MVDYFTFASLITSPPVLIMYALVLFHWGPVTLRSIRAGKMGAQDWLITGIVLGFTGGLGDVLYWLFAWHFDYTGHPLRDWFFEHGSVSNMFFRQGFGYAAGACHVVSSYMLSKQRTAPRVASVLLASTISAFIYAMALTMGLELPSEPWAAVLMINQVAIPALYLVFAAQVLMALGKIENIDKAKMWTLARIAAVFSTCATAGYISHLLMGGGHSSPFMGIAHSVVTLIMLRVIWRGRDAERLAGVVSA